MNIIIQHSYSFDILKRNIRPTFTSKRRYRERTRVRRDTTSLIREEMRRCISDYRMWGAHQMASGGELISHGTRGSNQACLVAEESSDPGLKVVGCGVVFGYVVEEGGVGYALEH